MLSQLLTVVQYVQPEMASQLNRIKQKPLNSILKDLVGGDGSGAGGSAVVSLGPSEAYSELVERVCDDLLEAADKQID